MRRLEQKITTGTPRQTVWKVLADFGGVFKWAPGIRRSSLKGDQVSGVGARRTIQLRWGFETEEVVTEWTDGEGYAFRLLKAPFPMRNVLETWNLESADGRTTITTTVSYDMAMGAIGAMLDATLVKFLVEREMRAGLCALST